MSDVAGRKLAMKLSNVVGRNLASCMTRMLVVKMPATYSVLQRFTTDNDYSWVVRRCRTII